jgi:chorismate mutase
MTTRAVRGATCAPENSESAILDAARELLTALVAANGLEPRDLVSIVFTMTPDLDAAYPTRAARELGWTHLALLDAQQPRVAGDLARCLRVLVLCETGRSPQELRHIYLGDAKKLRPDLA